jgi:hypothetical protein
MNSSRYSDNNSNAYSSYNMNNLKQGGGGGGGSNHYGGGGYVPNVNSNGLPQNYNYSQSGFYGGHPHMERAYTIINTEPIYVKSDEPIILVDPILERHVKSYLTFSIINVFLCWCIGGVITTVMSCNVMRLNDYKFFDEASKWSWRVLLANMIIAGVGAFIWFVVFPYIYVAIYPSLPKINW